MTPQNMQPPLDRDQVVAVLRDMAERGELDRSSGDGGDLLGLEDVLDRLYGRVPLGRIAYAAYCASSGGKSLISGAPLPAWDDQAEPIRAAWDAAAAAVAGLTQRPVPDGPIVWAFTLPLDYPGGTLDFAEVAARWRDSLPDDIRDRSLVIGLDPDADLRILDAAHLARLGLQRAPERLPVPSSREGNVELEAIATLTSLGWQWLTPTPHEDTFVRTRVLDDEAQQAEESAALRTLLDHGWTDPTGERLEMKCPG